MKLFGHPVHMMLIHFPSALFPIDFVCAIIYHYTGDANFATVSFFALVIGAAMGWLAILTGALDLILVTKENPNAVKKALVHGGINTVMLMGYSLLAYKAFIHYPQLEEVTIGILIIKGVLLAMLMGGDYLGGSLILKDKIGVEK